jgi:hypothetical protein
MENTLPDSVKATLWSYDVEKLDLTRDKSRIILQTLNHGNTEAVTWLKSTYSTNDLTATIEGSTEGEWSKKSLNYWSLIFHTKPKRVGRFL